MQFYESIFISDMHLGAVYSQTLKIYTFLSTHSANNLFLVGDIFDDHLDKEADWSSVQKIIDLLLTSTNYSKIVYIPGNHDSITRNFYKLQGFYNNNKLQIASYTKYKAQNGKTYLLIHGDEFDWIKVHLPFIFYTVSFFNHLFRRLLLRFVSINSESKIGSDINHRLNNILMNNNFFCKLVQHAKRENVQGIICGHFHVACIDLRPNLEYLNCGDWIDSCTAIVEDNKEFKLVEWR